MASNRHSQHADCIRSAPTKNRWSEAQNEAQKAHLQGISWLLVAFLNTYRVTALGRSVLKKKDLSVHPLILLILKNSF